MDESVVEGGNQGEIGWRRSPGVSWSGWGGGAPPWQLHPKKLSAIGGKMSLMLPKSSKIIPARPKLSDRAHICRRISPNSIKELKRGRDKSPEPGKIQQAVLNPPLGEGQPNRIQSSSQRLSRSMSKQIIHTDQAPAPVGPYNQAIIASGKLVFVAGQISLDPTTGEIIGQGDVEKQTVQVMANIEAILTAAGATFQDVVKTTVFLADMNDFATMNAVYARYFDEATAPARAAIQVSRLPKDVRVEIECIAMIEQTPASS